MYYTFLDVKEGHPLNVWRLQLSGRRRVGIKGKTEKEDIYLRRDGVPSGQHSFNILLPK
jgi:hypothetical protein